MRQLGSLPRVEGAIRFLAQYDPGHGDYTKERRRIFADLTWDEVLAEMKAGGAKSQ